ncbi:acyltransferase [Streptomyces globisporus]|uniref:acyltransferase n=1 Tax=Streptomyces globisporus TaxID=1908 RepID=UPI001F299AA6|nr:acyltransferase [Streptomyces globisporus]
MTESTLRLLVDCVRQGLADPPVIHRSLTGESSANRGIRRPDWMHIIRSKAFANLWMKAHKTHKAGFEVVEISGTDELHATGDWRAVFQESGDLNEVKEKDTHILRGKR